MRVWHMALEVIWCPYFLYDARDTVVVWNGLCILKSSRPTGHMRPADHSLVAQPILQTESPVTEKFIFFVIAFPIYYLNY